MSSFLFGASRPLHDLPWEAPCLTMGSTQILWSFRRPPFPATVLGLPLTPDPSPPWAHNDPLGFVGAGLAQEGRCSDEGGGKQGGPTKALGRDGRCPGKGHLASD